MSDNRISKRVRPKDDGWCTIRIRTATKADLTNLVSKRYDGVTLERVDDVINRHIHTVDLLHRYLVKEKYPNSGIVELDNDLEMMYCISTNYNQMEKDITDYQQRHRAWFDEQIAHANDNSQIEYQESK